MTNFKHVAAAILLLSLGSGSSAVELDPKIVGFKLPADIKWNENTRSGNRTAVLQGDPAQPNADVFFQVPGGAVIPSHRHTSAERMVLVEGRLRVQYRGQPAATLEPGGYAYGPAGRSHEATCESTGPCTLFIAFEGPVDAIAD